MELLDRVRATIRRHDLIRPSTRVVVGLSGGPDSVTLVHLLRTLGDAGELILAGVAHLNHRLRDEAGADLAFCADLARSLNLRFESGDADVRALAARDGSSVETAAHDARYEFLAAAADRLGAERIALGHTLDDQAETVLMRVLRGAGPRGLAGMHPRNGRFIRPLIEVRREALRTYLEAGGHSFRLDPSNEDCGIPRNRIRAHLLPWIAREFNPRIVETLGHEADLAREEWRWLKACAEDLLATSSRRSADEWHLDAQAFRDAPAAVARAALWLLMERTAAGRPIALPNVRAALDLFGPEGGAADLPGLRMERVGADVVLRGRPAVEGRPPKSRPAPNFFSHPLSIPGEVVVPEAGCAMSAEVVTSAGGFESGIGGRGEMAVVPLDCCGPLLTVRNRRPGDRFDVPGLNGRKKVQDLFVDRKVPRHLRDTVPLVVDDRNRIVWVPGHTVTREFRVIDPAQPVIILRLKLWGGSA